jgi:hypothetical protein
VTTLPNAARVVLAGVRIVNGTASLVAPATFARRLGIEPETNGPALYALRLFGVRTILIGAQLLSRNPEVRTEAVRQATRVHLSDAIAAAIAGATHQLPAKGAKAATITSTINTVLALIARRTLPPAGR